MSSSSSKPLRTRTHTLPDDRSLLLLHASVPRRKSASSLPSAAAAAIPPPPPRRRRTPSTTAGFASAFALSTRQPPRAAATAPPTPSAHSAAANSAALGPWGGTFLDAGPDADADADADTDSDGFLDSYVRARSRGATDSDTPIEPPTLSNARDSLISILDDPFFQRIHASGTGWPGDDGPLSDPATPSLPPDPCPAPSPAPAADVVISNPSPGQDSLGHIKVPRAAWPLPSRESTGNGQSLRPRSKSPTMESVNIAVIGADGVGKSAFIQRALCLAKPPTNGITAICLDVDGIPHMVALIELDLEHFDVDPDQKINWPKRISGHIVPHIDGALMLYDVMNPESVKYFSPTLSALHNSSLPTILVATKCDNPESARQINVDGLASVFPSVLSNFKTSANSPRNTRLCLQRIVLAALYNRKGAENTDSHPAASTRRRAASSAALLDTPPDSANGRPLSSEQGSSRHSRASSDLSLLRTGLAGATDRDGYYRSQNSRSPRVEYHNAPHLTSPSSGADMTDDTASASLQGLPRSPAIRLDAGQDSFLDIEESDAESLRFPDDPPALHRADELLFDKPTKSAGIPFDELVDRLLAPLMTRADNNFFDVFLCLYRKFAAPHELLQAVISRLDQTTDDKAIQFLERTATQFRYIEIIVRWVSLYPGDFARPQTRVLLEGLISLLADNAVFTFSAQQLREHLEHDVYEDDDSAWEKCDDPTDDDAPGTPASGPTGTLVSSTERETLPSDSMRSLTLIDSRSSGRPSTDAESRGIGGGGSGSGGGGRSGDSRGGSSSNLIPRGVVSVQTHLYDDYEREAAKMVPTGTLPLNKIRYHSFMALDADDIADEITRIDWIMFNSIRIRDLVRHVSLSFQEKERCRSLKSVNRMIAHFNHVARWVSNMILVRDKAKHRAPCMQKFMAIALRLRQLKNYNGLAAVLAGINGTAIHRLAQTRALVDTDIQKRFAQLVLLMSTQKSHFAYRLAWENSPPPRIPFIPLLRRDLVSAEEGSRTFVGLQNDRVNWKKFEVLGDVLLPIMKSQGTPYPSLRQSLDARDLILDCHMSMDEEELYQRSLQVEPGGTAVEAKKKFSWLPK